MTSRECSFSTVRGRHGIASALHFLNICGPDEYSLHCQTDLTLCRFYGREIAAYDIQTKRVDVYGQDEGYAERALLLYDGLHYDAMAQTGGPLGLSFSADY